MIMSFKQKEIKFKPRIKLNNNIQTWGWKFVASKVAQPRMWGGGNLFFKFRVSDFQHFHRIFSEN